MRFVTRALICMVLSSTASVHAAPDFAAIDTYVDAERRAMHIPGLALGIVGGDGSTHVAGFGDATPDTPFILGSTSKSFTALAVMQLVEADRIALDSPVQRYLPWFRVADEAASRTITVRHLLNQTSGFSTASGRATLTDFTDTPDALERRVRALESVALTAPVGTTYQYSNCNYQVLGLVVQTVAQEPYETYLASHILVPLGMQHSYTSKELAVANGLAKGHRAWFNRPFVYDEPLPRGSIPQGFIVSTASDMTRYLAAHMNGAAILSDAGFAELHRGAAPNGDASYAMGWNSGRIDDMNAIWHEGDTFSFKSTMAVLTDARWGVIVLSNMNNAPANLRVDELTFDVARMLAGHPRRAAHAGDSTWAHTIFAGVVLLQVVGMWRTVSLVRRWRADPASRPKGWVALLFRVGLPALVNLACGVVVLVWLPRAVIPLDALLMAVPDLAWPLVIGAVVAVVWSVARTAWIARSLRT